MLPSLFVILLFSSISFTFSTPQLDKNNQLIDNQQKSFTSFIKNVIKKLNETDYEDEETSSNSLSSTWHSLSCGFCQNLMTTNMDLLSQVTSTNENTITNFCDKILSHIGLAKWGKFICDTLLEAKLNIFINKVKNHHYRDESVKKICTSIKMCTF